MLLIHSPLTEQSRKVLGHRITKRHDLKGTSEEHLFQPSLRKQSYLEQIARKFVQAGFVSLQQRRLRSFSGQPNLILQYPDSKEVSP